MAVIQLIKISNFSYSFACQIKKKKYLKASIIFSSVSSGLSMFHDGGFFPVRTL